MIAATAGALCTLLALGAWERHQRNRAHAAIPVRIHVNGTRGKSTVTRLVAAGLRAGGYRTLAKTTGTAARVIGYDGRETPVPRRGPANIREQLWFLRNARRSGATAVVVECMALAPDLQVVSERDMVAATIGVITNARPDHADVMGDTPESVAAALSGTIPERGVLVVGPDLDPRCFVDAANGLGTVIRCAAPYTMDAPDTSSMPAWARANLATALTVTRVIGISDELAFTAMLSAAPDPGTVAHHRVIRSGRAITVMDASAANDPTSLGLLLGDDFPGRRLFVFNHRADRPLRLRQFAAAPPWRTVDAVMVTGERPDRVTRQRVEAGRVGGVPFVASRRLTGTLGRAVGGPDGVETVVLCGNARGLDARQLATELGMVGGV